MTSLRKLALIFTIAIVLAPAFSYASGPVFVIDFDDVLGEAAGTLLPQLPPDRIISDLDGHQIYLTKYAEEFVLQLASLPEAKVYIYSDSSVERIEYLMKQIKTPEGVLYEHITGIRSRADVTSFSQPVLGTIDDSYFRGTRKKDLSVFGNLDYVILIDNEAGNVLPGQEKNLLKIAADAERAKSFEIYGEKLQSNLSRYRTRLNDLYLHWNKLSLASAVINDAFAEWRNDSSVSLRELVFRRTYEFGESGAIRTKYFREGTEASKAIGESVRRFYQINPELHFKPLLGVWPRSCGELLRPVFSDRI